MAVRIHRSEHLLGLQSVELQDIRSDRGILAAVPLDQVLGHTAENRVLHLVTTLVAHSKQGPLVGQYEEVPLGVQAHRVRVVERHFILEGRHDVRGAEVAVPVDALDGVGLGIAKEEDVTLQVVLGGWGDGRTATGSEDLEMIQKLRRVPEGLFSSTYLEILIIQDISL